MNAAGPVPPADDHVRSGLAAWLDETAGGRHEVLGVERPSAGYSGETLLVAVRHLTAEGPEAPVTPTGSTLVVKLPPAGEGIFDRYDFGAQAQVQEAVAAAGIPTAVPARAEPDPRWLGAPFLAMPAVDGWIIGAVPALDRRLADAAPATNSARHRGFLHLVADINRIDLAGSGLDAVLDHRDNAAELAYWRAYLAWFAGGEVLVPALVDALDWCEAHVPATEPPPSLRWGDVRLENVILAGSAGEPDEAWQPAAVLDWEMAAIGAAEHDLAWMLALEATQEALVQRTVPGFLDREEAVRTYEDRLGRPVRDLDWYEVLAGVRSTAILSRIGHINARRGAPNLFPVADNPVLDLLARRIQRAERAGRDETGDP